MTEELGKIEKLPAAEFIKGRKLYFVPLILSVGETDTELLDLVNKYWEQVEAQLANLEDKLGKISCVFHELVPAAGEEGLKAIEAMCKSSAAITRSRLEKGGVLRPIEESDLLFEYLDWGRCLSIGLQSQQVFTHIYESYTKAQKLRNETISKMINGALSGDEVGMLLMREGHQVQFPADIQVFYVAPPGLDELKRWLRNREAATETEEENIPEGEKKK
jgi:hypothetical protein